MTAKVKIKRKSYCDICGKRLSFQTPFGDIKWRPSRLDDEGIYCAGCYLAKKADEKPEETED